LLGIYIIIPTVLYHTLQSKTEEFAEVTFDNLLPGTYEFRVSYFIHVKQRAAVV